MGIAERKERERHEMRKLILEKAKEVFIEEGYDKASIRAIAERIEYSPATIYLYFKDKDELFFAVHELGFFELFDQMQTLASIENPLERLRQMGFIYLRFAGENPEMYDLMFISRAPINALKKDPTEDEWYCGNRVFNLLCAVIQENMDKGMIRQNDLMVTALSIWSFVHGLASLHIRGRLDVFPQELDLRELVTHSIDNLINLIKA
ncbi:TetR/AcrR family transcriptional regulator [Siphonobacter aquaeclarae]|uniref:Transcriptional regulator, TetR family n=1 Tax=Siphonobacter aquaeclarae TaxID=563176 RepID=A0A1G9VYR2_9BACT|nr:TetR/AcrR family transcriptional regulator [Siphonobacter aquaeclarae]MBO9640437.1 TetR/AcrR family transcriptional regulator [Siphonobacter aquaeclarae]SDM77394.1 transcriptional regulator, TetR family [Siphonobacter aquaeclarae]